MEFYDPKIRVQVPPFGMFSANNLAWTPSNLCYIPWDRLSNFVDGEGRRDEFNETSFWIINSDHRPAEGASWLTKLTYWCAFGPTAVGNCEVGVPPMKGTFPKVGPGSRPRARKILFNKHIKRGCQSHFLVKRFKDYPNVGAIWYQNRYIWSILFLPSVM